MQRTMLKSKIHRATVTDCDLHYVGSITIDPELLEAADIREFEQVAVVDIDKLVVVHADVGRAIVMRRFHARGRGRASRVEKWFSNLRIVLAEREEEPEETGQEAA